ncbi:unnamed protein product [Caenorhabditis nigoni]
MAVQPHFSFPNVQLQMRFFFRRQCRALSRGHDLMNYPNGSHGTTSAPSGAYNHSMHQGDASRRAKLPTGVCVSHLCALSCPPVCALH